MGKLSPEKERQLAALEAERDATDDDDDDSGAIWVRLENGHTTRLSGQRARDYCRRHGIDVDEAEDSTRADPVEPEAGAGAAPAKKTAAAKKAPGKKAAAPAAGEEGAEELEGDPEPAGAAAARGRGMGFW